MKYDMTRITVIQSALNRNHICLVILRSIHPYIWCHIHILVLGRGQFVNGCGD